LGLVFVIEDFAPATCTRFEAVIFIGFTVMQQQGKQATNSMQKFWKLPASSW